jgi:hypothetical protein
LLKSFIETVARRQQTKSQTNSTNAVNKRIQ